MKRTIITLPVLAMLAAVSSSGPAQQDPLLGTWKQNLAKSQYDPSTRAPRIPPTVRRTALGINGYKQTTDGMNAQGAATHTELRRTGTARTILSPVLRIMIPVLVYDTTSLGGITADAVWDHVPSSKELLNSRLKNG